MKVLSLFDGMACGMIAMQLAGVEVESYDAYEIDKYAIKTAQHNFPTIKEHGDVFGADFTQYEGVDFLIGGSPCTYWSIAQTKNRETVASGMGWELFSQYVRALHEAKPKYFIYENNKSMSKAIRASIDETFGFEAVLINSALVSAQNRQRLYWVGKRNADGTYSRVNVEQPADRGILLKDVLDNAVAMREKAHAVIASAGRTTEREFFMKNQGNMVAEPVAGRVVGRRINEQGHRDDYNEEIPHFQYFEVNDDPQKTNCLTTVQKDNMIAVPARVGDMPSAEGKICGSQSKRIYSIDGKAPSICATETGGNSDTSSPATRLYAVPIPIEYSPLDNCDVVITDNNIRCSYKDGSGTAMGYSVYFDDVKSPTVISGQACKMKIIERVSNKNQYPVYEVRNGLITIKGKQYPIKLKDGYYIIRKLTVRECMRLQTVPEWYEFPVSNSQAYKMLGNGWTVDVIAHILKGLKEA